MTGLRGFAGAAGGAGAAGAAGVTATVTGVLWPVNEVGSGTCSCG